MERDKKEPCGQHHPKGAENKPKVRNRGGKPGTQKVSTKTYSSNGGSDKHNGREHMNHHRKKNGNPGKFREMEKRLK